MSYQKVVCVYCQAVFEDLVVAAHHSRTCMESPNAALIRAVWALKKHPCLQDSAIKCQHTEPDECWDAIVKAITELP